MSLFSQDFSPGLSPSLDPKTTEEFARAHGLVRQYLAGRDRYTPQNIEGKVSECFRKVQQIFSDETYDKFELEVRRFMIDALGELQGLQMEIEATEEVARSVVEVKRRRTAGDPESREQKRAKPADAVKEAKTDLPQAAYQALVGVFGDEGKVREFDSALSPQAHRVLKKLESRPEEFGILFQTAASFGHLGFAQMLNREALQLLELIQRGHIPSPQPSDRFVSPPLLPAVDLRQLSELAVQMQERAAAEAMPLPQIPRWPSVLVDVFPQVGMQCVSGGKMYTAKPIATSPGMRSFRFLSLEGGQWRDVGRVTIDEQTGAFIRAGDKHLRRLPVLPPILSQGMDALAQKLGTMSTIQARLVEEGVQPDEARRITKKWADQWHGCAVGGDVAETEVLVQYRGPDRIVGLKVGGRLGQRHADYTFDTLGSGGLKKAKKMVRITPDGQVIDLVRYAKIEVGGERIFLGDIVHELEVRKWLVEAGASLTGELSNEHLYDNILKLQSFVSHVGRIGMVKTRYIGERASSDLCDYIYFKGTENPLSPAALARNRPIVLRGCFDALRGLRQLHARGFVHKDFKLENVLLVDGIGKLADFGFTVRAGEPAKKQGTSTYMAPELYQLGFNEDSSMDMFSFGATLLEVFEPNGLGKTLVTAENDRDDGIIMAAKHHQIVQQVQAELRRRGTEPWLLISELIDLDPRRRPNSTETERRLAPIVAALPPQAGPPV
jgi:hypothetical protein